MAKVKKELEGNWELVSGGVFHKSWAGVIFRARGSAGAYFEGCTFPRQPEQPPPPPPSAVPVIWTVSVYGFEPEPFVLVLIFSVRRFDEVRGAYTHRIERTYEGFITVSMVLEVVSVTYDADNFEKVYRVISGTPDEPEFEDYVRLSVPPFNGLPFLGGTVDNQEHIFP